MLNLQEDPAANHVRAMATYFNAELDEGNDASTITMDNDKAKGFISSYRLFSGLSVWVYNITFLSDFKVELELSEDRPCYFSYNVKGHFLHRFGNEEEFVKILQNQNMIVRGSPVTSVQIEFTANVKLELAIIVIDTKLLGNLDIRNAKRINTKVQSIFQTILPDLPSRHLGKIDSETEKYASIVCKNKNTNLIGGLLTEGAVLNMLESQIRAYDDDTFKIGPQSVLSRSELSKISALGSYIIEHFQAGTSILELSNHLGLSPKKLQIGVKYLYGDSVGHYILNLRMGHAKELFATTELNVSEVCDQIGLSSYSYFSKIFKNRYGVLPSKCKN